MHASLVRSYRFCEQLTRREAGNFYPAFQILPASQRLSMCALYAFLRITDDLGDESGATIVKRDQLGLWRQGFDGASRGRVYLPRDELRRFGYSEDKLRRGERDDAFRCLMRFQVERARAYYVAAWPLVSLLSPAGRAVFLIMAKTYRGLLHAIEANDY